MHVSVRFPGEILDGENKLVTPMLMQRFLIMLLPPKGAFGFNSGNQRKSVTRFPSIFLIVKGFPACRGNRCLKLLSNGTDQIDVKSTEYVEKS